MVMLINNRRIGVVLPLALAALLGPSKAWGQGTAPPDDAVLPCGVTLTPEEAAVALYLQSIGAYEPPSENQRFIPSIPVTIHIVNRDDGTGGITTAQANQTLTDANTLWNPTMQFFVQGPIFIINDTGLYDTDNALELALLTSTMSIPDTVNIYFVNTLTVLGNAAGGIASFSYMPWQGVVVVRANTSAGGTTSTLAHEFGHYFDLYHTHENAFGWECPDGSNCDVAGDLVCDTPADPGLSSANVNITGCVYTGGGFFCGQPWVPDPTVVMSYAPDTCTNLTTPQQRTRALATLSNSRPNLIDQGNPTITWVNFNALVLFPNGSFAAPYTSLLDGLAFSPAGSRVVMRAGTTNETGVFANPAILDAFEGSAIIGQP